MIQIKLLAGRLSNDGDTFVDGAVIAAARTVPTWSDGDVPPIPSLERKAVKELQEECQQMLAEFPTNSEQDQKLLGKVSTLIPLSKTGLIIGLYVLLAFDMTYGKINILK